MTPTSLFSNSAEPDANQDWSSRFLLCFYGIRDSPNSLIIFWLASSVVERAFASQPEVVTAWTRVQARTSEIYYTWTFLPKDRETSGQEPS
jgi:hypothetical protein